jgi:hypothetical protein
MLGLEQKYCYRDAEETAVQKHHAGDEPFKVQVLGDVVCKSSELFPVWPGRQVQRLGDFQSLLQVAPVRDAPFLL